MSEIGTKPGCTSLELLLRRNIPIPCFLRAEIQLFPNSLWKK